MAQKNKRPECVLGFYQVVEQPGGEMSGGILITSHLGRPIEFQCSLPVRPNATQQTLYGATLRPFMIGELIAQALKDRLQVLPDVLFVNQPEALNDQTWGNIPVLCSEKTDAAVFEREFRQTTYWIASSQEKDFVKILEKISQHVPESADLQEPLTRVEQALQEAMGQAA